MDWRNRRLGESFITQQAAGAFSFSNPNKREIVNELWGVRLRNLQDFDVFFEFMNARCEFLDPINHVIETYGDLLDLIQRLKTFRNRSRMDIRDEIRGEYGGAVANVDDQRISNSIELAVRIWMMLSLGTAGLAPIPGKRELPFPWNDGQSLNGILISTFPTAQDNEPIREFSDLFNLWDVKRLAGLEIRPTDNILDHLLLQKHGERKFTSTVFIFYHATLLKELMIGDPSSRLGDANGSFAIETLQTLGLLIPNYTACQNWFQALIQSSTTIDPRAGTQHPTTRRVCDYKYWRTRLLILEGEFDKAEGAGVISYLKDRRKPREYATFWIAVLAFVFALLAFLLTLWSAIEAELSREQSVLANSMASVASTLADASASSSRSAASVMNGSTSSPVTIVVCCNSSVSANNSFSITSSGTVDPATMTNSTTLALVTSTIIAITTTTTSITQDVTTTVIITIPITT